MFGSALLPKLFEFQFLINPYKARTKHHSVIIISLPLSFESSLSVNHLFLLNLFLFLSDPPPLILGTQAFQLLGFNLLLQVLSFQIEP